MGAFSLPSLTCVHDILCNDSDFRNTSPQRWAVYWRWKWELWSWDAIFKPDVATYGCISTSGREKCRVSGQHLEIAPNPQPTSSVLQKDSQEHARLCGLHGNITHHILQWMQRLETTPVCRASYCMSPSVHNSRGFNKWKRHLSYSNQIGFCHLISQI